MSFQLPIGRPALMGILNITPDSFSDGGVHFRAEDAVRSGLTMLQNGADILDIGGESTRPGAEEVPIGEELRRVLPVVDALAKAGAIISIDTKKASVAEAALDAGAQIVNDITALSDPEMRDLCAERNCRVCLMHMQGTPQTMQKQPVYGDVVEDVFGFLVQRAEEVAGAGVRRENIWIDPGIGFGKTVEHNLALLRNLGKFTGSGYPVLIGVSRKSFIGRLLGKSEPLPSEDRLEGTLALQALAQLDGAAIIRAHDVKESRRVINTLAAVVASEGS